MTHKFLRKKWKGCCSWCELTGCSKWREPRQRMAAKERTSARRERPWKWETQTRWRRERRWRNKMKTVREEWVFLLILGFQATRVMGATRAPKRIQLQQALPQWIWSRAPLPVARQSDRCSCRRDTRSLAPVENVKQQCARRGQNRWERWEFFLWPQPKRGRFKLIKPTRFC
jgi:hypothetical protein